MVPFEMIMEWIEVSSMIMVTNNHVSLANWTIEINHYQLLPNLFSTITHYQSIFMIISSPASKNLNMEGC